MAIGDRIQGREFNVDADNDVSQGISVDSTYAYVVDAGDDKVYVYRLSDGARQTGREFDLHADNGQSQGISVDSTYAYVVDTDDDKVYVYRLSDGVRQTGREFDLHADNGVPRGISVDSTYAYVVQPVASSGGQSFANHVYVYRLSDGARQTGREFDLHTSNGTPRGISIGSTYAYVVNVSPNSVYVYSILPPEAAPGPPASPNLTPGINSLAVSWQVPSSIGTSPITAYDIRHKPSLGGSYTTIHDAWTSGSRSYTITSLTGGISYGIQVRGVSAVGDGGWSPVATATAIAAAVSVPGQPNAPGVSIVGTRYRLAWDAPSNSGPTITEYERRLRYTTQTSWGQASIWMTGDGVLEGDGGRASGDAGATTEWQVRAINSAGNGPWSASTFFTGAAAPPGAPTITSIIPSTQQLIVIWSAPSSTGGAAITSYDVRYRIGNGGYTTINPATTGALTYTILNLTGGTTYSVEVRAVNSAGDGPWSTADMGTTTVTVTGAPAAPVLTDTATTITATWDAPASTGGAAISSYDIRHRVGSNAWVTLQDIWSAGTRSYTITGLSPNTTYDVQVRARNSEGAGGWSGTTSRTTDTTIPGQPEIVALSPGDGGLAVQWLPPTSDGGAAIANYDVRWRAV